MNAKRALIAYAAFAAMLLVTGWQQSWAVLLGLVNVGLISAIMALGVNIQWGYAGLFNVGVIGFAALGGMAAVLVGMPPVAGAWAAGGGGLALALACVIGAVIALRLAARRLSGSRRFWAVCMIVVLGYGSARYFYGPASSAIEAIDAARYGYLGGLGLPVLWSWLAGAALAAGAAWLIGRIALGLRADYLAIATLGISEIIVALAKNEEWLTRGVKNVTGLPRPVPYEVDLQQSAWFADWVARLEAPNLLGLSDAARAQWLADSLVSYAGVVVKLCYTGLFGAVVLVLLWLSSRALHSPWGRMMRAVRDNEAAAQACGKSVTGCHLQVFVLGAAVIGLAGAMLATLDGQFTPGSYHPLRFGFLIWLMVIVGGSGNNLGAVLGGFVIWFLWVQAEPAGGWLLGHLAAGLQDPALSAHLLESAQHMRMIVMGLVLLLVLRLMPGGILPEVAATNDDERR